MSFFEAGMLVCFGMAWPTSIIKSWRARTAKGKSVFFLFIVLIGYACGIVHKILYNMDIVILFYILNLLMVAADICIYYRNRRIDLDCTSCAK